MCRDINKILKPMLLTFKKEKKKRELNSRSRLTCKNNIFKKKKNRFNRSNKVNTHLIFIYFVFKGIV